MALSIQNLVFSSPVQNPPCNTETQESLAKIFQNTRFQSLREQKAFLVKSIKTKDIQSIRILFEEVPCYVNYANETLRTPLHYAALYGYLKAVKHLFHKGAILDSQDCEGHSPLHYAAKEGHLKIAKFFLKQGAFIDCKSKKGFTALHFAVKYQHSAVAIYLLSKGSDSNCKTNQQLTALEIAANNAQPHFVEMLLKKGATPDHVTSLHYAAAHANPKTAHYFLTKGLDINCQTNFDLWTPLHFATAYAQTANVRYLLSKGALVTCRTKKDGLFPLHLAVRGEEPKEEQSRLEIVKLLIENNAPADSKDIWGKTALQMALLLNRLKIAQFLMTKTANMGFVRGSLPSVMKKRPIGVVVPIKK